MYLVVHKCFVCGFEYGYEQIEADLAPPCPQCNGDPLETIVLEKEDEA
jgi:DNA-directed RNA polymerase subunit RPC12/RpoP